MPAVYHYWILPLLFLIPVTDGMSSLERLAASEAAEHEDSPAEGDSRYRAATWSRRCPGDGPSEKPARHSGRTPLIASAQCLRPRRDRRVGTPGTRLPNGLNAPLLN